MEFEKQIESFTQKELLKEMQKKEMLKANKQYWEQQIKWNDAQKQQAKKLEQHGGTQPLFIKKMFKYAEQLDVKKDQDIENHLPDADKLPSRA